MSATETQAPANSETPAETPAEPTRTVKPVEELDGLRSLVITQAKAVLAEFAKVDAELNAQTDFEKSLPELRENSEDEKVKALQAKVEKAIAAINEWQRAQDEILTANRKVLSDEERTELEAKRNSHRDSIKALVTVFDNTSEMAGDDARLIDYVEVPSNVMRQRSASAGTSSAGNSTGTRRLRVKNVYVQEGVNLDPDKYQITGTQEKATFTNLVQWFDKNKGVKVATSDLHKAYFEQAKTDDFDKIPNTVDYAYSVDGTNYWIRVVKHND